MLSAFCFPLELSLIKLVYRQTLGFVCIVDADILLLLTVTIRFTECYFSTMTEFFLFRCMTVHKTNVTFENLDNICLFAVEEILGCIVFCSFSQCNEIAAHLVCRTISTNDNQRQLPFVFACIFEHGILCIRTQYHITLESELRPDSHVRAVITDDLSAKTVRSIAFLISICHMMSGHLTIFVFIRRVIWVICIDYRPGNIVVVRFRIPVSVYFTDVAFLDENYRTFVACVRVRLRIGNSA